MIWESCVCIGRFSAELFLPSSLISSIDLLWTLLFGEVNMLLLRLALESDCSSEMERCTSPTFFMTIWYTVFFRSLMSP